MAGLMDGLMDQISNHSNLEREAVGLPDRRPTRRVWRVAAASVALAVLAAFTYLGFFHHRKGSSGRAASGTSTGNGKQALAARGRHAARISRPILSGRQN